MPGRCPAILVTRPSTIWHASSRHLRSTGARIRTGARSITTPISTHDSKPCPASRDLSKFRAIQREARHAGSNTIHRDRDRGRQRLSLAEPVAGPTHKAPSRCGSAHRCAGAPIRMTIRQFMRLPDRLQAEVHKVYLAPMSTANLAPLADPLPVDTRMIPRGHLSIDQKMAIGCWLLRNKAAFPRGNFGPRLD